MLAGQLPFLGPDVHDFRQQHLEDTQESISGVPLKLQSLIDECLYKSPEARPRPQNLLARLNKSVWVVSEAASRLQQANALAVQKRAEAARQESLAKSDAERRLELCEAADRSLKHVVALLNDQILSNAPASEPTGPSQQWLWSLNDAKLSVAPSRDEAYGSPFEIMAYSSITLQIKPDSHGFEGRSHSLWYCDAQEAGVFRWYEATFMIMPLIPKRGRIDPFALSPGRDAYVALSPVMGEYQVAWPFAPIDQGDESDFIERWLGWRSRSGAASPS